MTIERLWHILSVFVGLVVAWSLCLVVAVTVGEWIAKVLPLERVLALLGRTRTFARSIKRWRRSSHETT